MASLAKDAIWDALDTFLQEMDRVGRPNLVHAVLLDGHKPTNKDLGQNPEEYVEDNLIWPILNILGIQFTKRPFQETGRHGVWPDFRIDNLQGKELIGENKAPNEFHSGEKEVADYLDRRSIGADYGIATDGLRWGLYHLNISGDVAQFRELDVVDLRPALVQLGSDQGILPENVDLYDETPDGAVKTFLDVFERDALLHRVTEQYPRWIREEQRKDVDAFFDLYIELLFGEGNEHTYQTCLVNEIQSPARGTEKEKRLFAISLVNRLLFTKFLEDVGVLDTEFLTKRVSDYEETGNKMAGNLYETQLKPIFYDLFNTKKGNRKDKYSGSWFKRVPYLNGGLFKPNINDERSYTVTDGILKKVVKDLIEGHQLREHFEDRRLDPAILGSVFEKTITYIENDYDQDIGAHYTPDDVTSIIVRNTLSKKAKDVFVDVFSSHAGGGEEVKGSIEDRSLEDILRRIEESEGWFGLPEALEEVEEQLLDLRMVDPSCGSGHFLTSLMAELYRLWESVYRGRNGGDAPSDEEKYKARKRIALTCIYGVDVDPIAVEIGRLRVWLKIIEDLDWKPEFGALPNIDLNILAGNSLVGLPLKESGRLPLWMDSIDELTKLRRQHKFDEAGRKQDIEELREKTIQPAANEAFLKQFEEKREWSGESSEEVEIFLDEIDPDLLFSVTTLFRIRNARDDYLTEPQKEYLDKWAATPYSRQARLNPDDLIEKIRVEEGVGREEALRQGQEWLSALEEEDLHVTTIERGVIEYDLSRSLGNPFHWPVLFPELTNGDSEDHSIHFDIIVGNPPYGNLVGPSEQFFLERYLTRNISDISAPFVERQLQLLDKEGYFGNITTARLVYKQDIPDFHEMLREKLIGGKMACFAKRPSKIFTGDKSAEVRCSVITGKKSENGSLNKLETSKFIRFNESDRDEKLRNIKYSQTEPYILTKSIGGEGSHRFEILPKVGEKEIRGTLEHWKGMDFQVREFTSEGGGNSLHIREGSDYWLCAMIDPLYQANNTGIMRFDSEVARSTTFLTVHSSMFYMFWMVYGDQFHLYKSMVSSFPIPSPSVLSRHESSIMAYRGRLWEGLKKAFDEDDEEFTMQPLKPLIDEVDNLLGKMMGMPLPLIEYSKRFQEKYRMQAD